MKSLIRKLFRLLPEQKRLHLIRQNVRVPAGLNNIVLKLATTKDELEQAYCLLHDSYVGQSLMDPHPSGMRFNIWSALPYTSVIVAKIENKVVGTVSLIKDSPIGFPSDKIYQEENNAHRKNRRRMVEVSAFAVDPMFRQDGHKISLYLMKYLYQYSQNYLNADMLCATIRKHVLDFYKALFSFEQNGKAVRYDFVKGTLAVQISLDLTCENIEKIQNMYSKYPAKSNIYNFCVTPETQAAFEFPKQLKEISMNPVMTPLLLDYFLVKKTGLYRELSPRMLELVHSAYSNHPDLANTLPKLQHVDYTNRPNFRYLTNVRAVFMAKNISVIGTILDLSTDGAFFAAGTELPNEAEGQIIFTIQGQKYQIPCSIIWMNRGNTLRYPTGLGIKFEKSVPFLNELFQKTNMNLDPQRRVLRAG